MATAALAVSPLGRLGLGAPETDDAPTSVASQDRVEAARRRQELATLYRQHAPKVLRWAVRLGGPFVDPEDVLQEVFCAVWNQLERFEHRSRITTWLFAITRNIVCERIARDRHRRDLLRQHTEGATTSSYDPVGQLEQRQSLALVYRILMTMPEKYRTVFALFELEGLDAETISQMTGININTLRVQLMRGRAQFSRRFEAMAEAA
jgi:RNA polymerase sigma-70 factor (ECF subfamily)